MKELAESFAIISNILNDSGKHKLSKDQINALLYAQKAISIIELLNISITDRQSDYGTNKS
jgi:hypothetical protein